MGAFSKGLSILSALRLSQKYLTSLNLYSIRAASILLLESVSSVSSQHLSILLSVSTSTATRTILGNHAVFKTSSL